jgi:Tfp pilus assembly protein PilN
VRAVNLLPTDVVDAKTREINAPLLAGVIGAVIVTFVLAAGFLHESAKVAHNRTELDAAHAELALIPAPAPIDSVSSTLAGEQTQRVAALQTALNGRMAWDRLLREISLVLPGDVWLSDLTLQAPTTVPVTPDAGAVSATPATPTSTTPAPTATGLTMNGSAFSHQGVARLLSRLALVPDLENVTLGHSTRVNPGKRGPVEFSVTAGIRAPGATS